MHSPCTSETQNSRFTLAPASEQNKRLTYKSVFQSVLALFIILLFQSTLDAQSLDTGASSDWALAALYFDIEATNTVSIHSFEIDCQDYVDPNVDVINVYKRNTYGSFEFSTYTPSEWQVISTTSVSIDGTQSALTGVFEAQIDAGETQAFMIHISQAKLIGGDGDGSISIIASNADIGVTSGVSFAEPFVGEYPGTIDPKLVVNYCLTGCMDVTACNYDSSATCDDGSCTYPQWYIPTDLGSGPAILTCDQPSGYYLADQTCALNTITSDSYCINNSWDAICMSAYNCCVGNFGCGEAGACNYDPTLCPDASLCIMPGCTNSAACNYDSAAPCDDGSCILPQWYIPSVIGTGPMVQACTAPPGYFLANQGCAQQIVTDDPFCLNINWDLTCQVAYNCCEDPGTTGCLNENACNYDPTVCSHAEICTYPGCTDAQACNYDATAGCDDGSCTYPGCTDAQACNYDSTAGCDDGFCSFAMWYLPIAIYQGPMVFTCTPPDNYYLADQVCAATMAINDPFCVNNNWDLLCNSAYNCCANPEVGGCTVFGACNYNMHACFDDGTCLYGGCLDPMACNYDSNASCDNEACTYPDECGNCFSFFVGCTDSSACNYSLLAQCDDGSCIYPACTDPAACNYDSTASCSGETCVYPGCTYPFACNYDPNAACDDGSCETTSCSGCTNSAAPEYDPTATIDDGSCTIEGTDNCPGDFNGDMIVNTTDLLTFLGLFSTECN